MLKFPQTDVNVIDIKPNKFSRLLFSYTFLYLIDLTATGPATQKLTGKQKNYYIDKKGVEA